MISQLSTIKVAKSLGNQARGVQRTSLYYQARSQLLKGGGGGVGTPLQPPPPLLQA